MRHKLSELFGLLRDQAPVKTADTRPFFNVTAQTDDSPAEIVFYGDVFEEAPRDWWTGEPIEGMHISLEEMKDKIESVKDASEILIRLNSSGGDLFAGITLHNLIKALKGHKTVRVDGLAASAASIIMCAGDTVELYPSSMVMIHNVASFLWGYVSTTELRDLLSDYEAAEKSMRAIYAAKTGMDDDAIQAMIDATTWMVGAEAIDEGFADELITDDEDDEPEPELIDDGHTLMVAGIRHNLTGILTPPPMLAAHPMVSNVAEATRNTSKSGLDAPDVEEEIVEITNEAELRAAYPDLVASVETQAVNGERARLQAIEKVGDKIADKQMVDDAKFAEPITAETLLYNAAMQDKLGNNAFLAAVAEDGADSKADEVAADPADVSGAVPDADDELVNQAISFRNGRKGE